MKSANFWKGLGFCGGFVLLTAAVVPSAQAAVVINEVYGGGGNSGSTFKNDFIELYNNGTSTVDLRGYSVQYVGATGVFSTANGSFTPLTGTIAPGSYYLIQETAGSGGTTNLPTPDATGNISMSATAGKVALASKQTAISSKSDVAVIDFVGFGTTANEFEGTGPTSAPSNTASVSRNPIGRDTNDNKADFVLTNPPTPMNSSSGSQIPVATSGAIISEFRFHGATGSSDEYVELYNTQGTPLNISGWSIRINTGSADIPTFQTAAVPQNIILPARGHFLFTGTGYSLTGYGTSNAGIGADAADDSGVALFNAEATPVRQDAVGFTSSDVTLREGAGLPSAPTVTGKYAFMRDFTVSLPKDSGDSTNDFVFVSAAGNTAVAGTNGNVTPQLGAPSPEGLSSPVYVNNQVSTLLLDSGAAQGASPNRVRLGSGDSGTLIIRRRIVNNSGRTLNRVRFTVTRITSLGSATTFTNQADIRLITSPDEASVATSAGNVAVSGTSLESPSAESPGGALGSSVSYNAVLATPLAAGASGNYAFRFNIAKAGSFLVALNIEALPNP